MDWWQRNIVEPDKLPLFLCVVAFLVTFATTRLIVRSIRAGRGPFRNLSAGGTHIHHVVPGTILMVAGGILGLAELSEGANALAGVLFGMGLALVLDEFALIFHLDDVYWEAQGRLSVDAVFLVGGMLVLMLLGASPEGVDGLSSEVQTARWIILVELVVVLACIVVACLKGKVVSGLLGLLIPPLALFAAARVARPHSPWARWFYSAGSARLARSTKRSRRNEKLWRGPGRNLMDRIAGAPTPGSASSSPTSSPSPAQPASAPATLSGRPEGQDGGPP